MAARTGDAAEGLGPAFAAFWRRSLDSPKRAGPLLEVGAGTGAVARWLSQQPSAPWIVASDLSQPRAADVAPLCFVAGARLEQLPFRDAAFGAVISQFAIEYAERSAAVVEVARVLAPGGRLALVLHRADGLLVRVARHERAHHDWVLQTDGLLDAAAGLVPYLARAATPQGLAGLRGDPHAEQARQRYHALQQQLEQRAAGPHGDCLWETNDALGRLLQQARAGAGPAVEAGLAQLRQSLLDARLRLEELDRHALDGAGLQAWIEQLAAQGVSHHRRCGELEERGEALAWTLEVERAS